jgi:MoaA/NifB/PqqE/SkfB family radical SAM enzyme
MNQKKADLKIGFRCNNYCRHCVQGNKRERFGNKSLTLIKQELKRAINDCDHLVLTGGEPTIHENFLEVVRYAKKLGFKNIQLQTNGRRFCYFDFCKQAIDAGVNSFVFGLAGHIPELHDYITNVCGSFRQTVNGIYNVKSLGQEVTVNFIVSKPNYRYLKEAAGLLVKLGVSQYQFAFIHPMGRAGDYFYSMVPRLSIIEPYIKKGIDIGIRAGKAVMTEAIPFCFMCGYEPYIAESMIPDTVIYDADKFIEDYTFLRQHHGKLKGELCEKCRYFKVCEGPWREYPEKYGWQEFKAVK